MAFDIDIRQGPRGSRLYVPIDARCPGIVVLHGSEGGFAGWSDWEALILAGYGFCTIAPGYSRGGNAWHAGDIRDVDLDATESMLIWMRESGISSGRVGLFGTSRGAEHALLVTSLMAREQSAGLPDAVAVHAPSDVIVGAFMANDFQPGGELPPTCYEPAWRWRGASDTLRPDTPIEIERYDGPLFISHALLEQWPQKGFQTVIRRPVVLSTTSRGWRPGGVRAPGFRRCWGAARCRRHGRPARHHR